MRILAALLVGLAVTLAAAVPAHALTDQERSALIERFGKVKDLKEFAGPALDAALKDPRAAEFFENYSHTLTVVSVADKIANAEDWEAFKIIASELSSKVVERLAPKLASALGFVGWVHTGLTLFKDYVFDPWIEKKQMTQYMKRRDQGLEPDDVTATVIGWGHTRERALKQLEKQGYNMELLWEGGERGKLSAAWEARLLQFVTASFEAQYQRKLLADGAKKGKKELPGLDKKAKKFLKDAADDDEGGSGEVKWTGKVELVQGKNVEFWVNDRLVTKGAEFTVDASGTIEVRVVVVGARRQQSRDLAKKRPAKVTLEGTPTDYDFAYSMGGNSSAWEVSEETYDWKAAASSNKPLGQSWKASHAAVKQDVLVLTLAGDLLNEKISIDVSGRVTWKMTGKRANGAAVSDSADEGETAAIVLTVAVK